MSIHAWIVSQKVSQFLVIFYFAAAQSRSVDQDEVLVAMFFQRLSQRRRIFEDLASDTQNRGVGPQFIGCGDPVCIRSKDLRGPPRGDPVLD